MRRLVLAALAGLLLLAPAANAARKASFQVNATVVPRFGDQIGFIPVTGMQPTHSARQRIKVGRKVLRVRWNNTVSNARTAKIAASMLTFDSEAGLFLDRPLTESESPRAEVLAADIARDADVLVVHRDNPVCTSGLTYAQAAAIAAGQITDWSQVGSDAGPVHLTLKGEGFPHGLFGVEDLPPGAGLQPDGGVGSTFADVGAASVTHHSIVRGRPGPCVVALDGVAPSDATVASRAYPGAYAISFVMSRDRSRRKRDRARVRAYVEFLRSERARAMFARAGVWW